MLQNVTIAPARRSLEFGIYRDGDNNLDAIQESTLSQALHTSARDSSIEFTVEDTTTLRPGRDTVSSGSLHTERYTIADGVVGNVGSGRPDEMSDEASLARFVARTLDNAQLSGAKQTWIDLVDHGGGDGGGLETSDGSVMSMPDIAKAISDGLAMHAAALTTKHANLFLRRTLRCVVISATSPQSLRFEMFERLNTGGVPLNDQELRNCIFHGTFNDLLRGLATNPIWQQALGLEEPDQRMADMELALRYFALRSNLNNYKPPLKEALNDYMKTHRNPSEESLVELNETILSTVEKVKSVFGDKLFRRVRVLLGKTENATLWDRGINRAVFDIQMLAFESLDSKWLTKRRSKILSAFEELCSTDAGFIDSVTSATANRSAVITRLRKWGVSGGPG